MNELNYASFESSKRLYEAGIVLETEKTWFFSNTGWEMVGRYAAHHVTRHYLPAPSMAEVWRELPEEYCKNATDPVRYKVFMSSQVGYHSGGKDGGIWIPYKGNPTDALIDLLVWLKGEGK
jgi:hypothetical protein